MRKSWYDPSAPAVSTTSEIRKDASLLRARRDPRREMTLGAALIYPLRDGPGVALLVVMPPLLFLLSLPVFDWLAIVDPFRRANWAMGLLALPIFLPLLFSFAMTIGYTLLFLGQVVVASAMGEYDHPNWPEWNGEAISEGLGRWLWAFAFGVTLGGFPTVVYWIYCGQIDRFDQVVFADLVIAGAGYAELALAASLLHDHLLAANPVLVLLTIRRLGWDFVQPCLVAGIAVLLAGGALWSVLFLTPSVRYAAAGLWAFWVLALYEAMVALRVLGLTYHAHACDLCWFRARPKWATSSYGGRIYSNS